MKYIIFITCIAVVLVYVIFKIISRNNFLIRVGIVSTLFLLTLFVTYRYITNNNSKLRTVLVTTTSSSQPNMIHFEWGFADVFAEYIIYRRAETSQSWGSPIAKISGFHTGFTDSDIEQGKAYEYKIHKLRPFYEGYTFVYAGVNYEAPPHPRSVLLLIDENYKEVLGKEILQLQLDLAGEGWRVVSQYIDPQLQVWQVKNIIKKEYLEDATLSTVFILGHIAVPYSGNFAFDWHPNHKGAWPADSYYADIDGAWTDSIVNNTNAVFPGNYNVPGDGKYDKSFLSNDVRLEIGRVDFSDLPVFEESEIELTRQYLHKNHEYRNGLWNVTNKGIIYDQFPSIYEKRANASTGWRNFSALFGKSNIDYGNIYSYRGNSLYAFSYACGAGSFTSAGDFVTSKDFAQHTYKSVFTILFGSYFGDWNTRDNISRAALASKGAPLVTCWAGHPAWYFHHMALGKHIGFSGKISINNNGAYIAHKANRGIHMTLLGDPTLRLHMYRAVKDVLAQRIENTVLLTWSNIDSAVIEYVVYRSNALLGNYSRINTEPVLTTSYRDTLPFQDSAYYMIRAVKVQQSGSGTYLNKSAGVMVQVD